MTESEYDALTSACDALLLSPDADADRVALAWLHVRNEHPHILEPYLAVFGRQPIRQRARTWLRYRVSAAWVLLQSALRPIDDLVDDSMPFAERADVLFLSHTVSPDVRADAPDFYFGTLADELARRGLTSVTLLHNHYPERDAQLRKALTRGGAAARILMPRWSTVAREWRNLSKARLAGRAVTRNVGANDSAFTSVVARNAAAHAANPATLATRRVGDIVRRMCQRFRPRVLIATWEGHAWERIAFQAARSVDPAIRCIGYQHTTLFERSHALRRALGKLYDADAILTIGDVNRALLVSAPGLCGVPVTVYGSHRRHGQTVSAPNPPSRCLVMPDGIEDECLILFDFALAAARGMPEVRFRLRTHPYLPFDDLARRHPYLKRLPPNVEVSSARDISADFAECTWAVYRGSSASIHAVLMGVRPIYLAREGELPFDPLFALETWRGRIQNVGELRAIIAADRAADASNRRDEWHGARDFCDRYVVAPDPEVVYRLIGDAPARAPTSTDNIS